jgi:hypothetical protein
MTSVDAARFPEWLPFAEAVTASDPSTGTWCEAWTVRDIVAHQAGNAEELARVLAAHLAGHPVKTRSFEEREAPFRAMGHHDRWDALVEQMVELGRVTEAATDLAPDTDVAWTGRAMKPAWFAEHMREELILHGWDITGDTPAARDRLAQPWMTEHSVRAVGPPLLRNGIEALGPDEEAIGRLRVSGTDDVLVSGSRSSAAVQIVPVEGDATLETDAATRVLLLWGRRPADPARIRSDVGATELGRIRTLLSGY